MTAETKHIHIAGQQADLLASTNLYELSSLLLDKDCLEAPLKNMANSPVSSVETLGLDTVQKMHAL